MVGAFRHRVHPRGILFNALERTFLTTSAMIIALVTLIILFLGIYMRLV